MNHEGKAGEAGRRILLLSVVLMGLLFGLGFLASLLGPMILAAAGFFVGLWIVFVVFTLYFFRDPEPRVPEGENLILSPGHGKVDVIDEMDEKDFMGGNCKRVSIFLSVFDVHVQNAPVAGKVALVRHKPGQFLNAIKADSALYNENVLVGFECDGGRKLSIRLIAGLIARRIVPWVQREDTVAAGERISLIQFGSRVDVYLPPDAEVTVRLGERVIGGETVLAHWK
jgi:phosphatidylserine decarboxylase